jgi:hypothetical protein
MKYTLGDAKQLFSYVKGEWETVNISKKSYLESNLGESRLLMNVRNIALELEGDHPIVLRIS